MDRSDTAVTLQTPNGPSVTVYQNENGDVLIYVGTKMVYGDESTYYDLVTGEA